MSSDRHEPAARRVRRGPTLLMATAIVVATAAWWEVHLWRTPRLRSGPIVLVVEPFRVVGAGVEPWSGAGLAAEVRGALDTVSGMSARIADHDAPPSVDYVIGGTISRDGTRDAIAIELVRHRDHAVLWTDTYWRGEGELTSLSGDLAQAVVQSVFQDTKRGRRR